MARQVSTFVVLLLIALNGARLNADVIEESENRVLKSLKTVILAVDVTEEAAKLGITSEVVSKEVSKVLKTSKIEEAKPEKGKARPVFIVKLYLGTEFKKAQDINDVVNQTANEAPNGVPAALAGAKNDARNDAKKTVKKSLKSSGDDRIAGYLQVRIADLAKIERLGDQPVSVNSFERIYPFQSRPQAKVKEAVLDVLIGKTFKRDFRGAVKAARASESP